MMLSKLDVSESLVRSHCGGTGQLIVSWSGYCNYDGEGAKHFTNIKSGIVCPETKDLWAI
jgi:hypothetical protein